MKEEILKKYDEEKVIYIELEYKIKDLINSLLKEEGITIHGVESRVKDRDSLSKKIVEKDEKYSSLNEITDTLGLRVITYFEDDVDKIAEILKKEFYLDIENSIDKRHKDPESFGYSSLHYILKLKKPRADLSEYSRFNDYKFELQIRSILQHVWAEIEHDLGYKSKNAVPEEIRRDFSRIAGLLELADKEFIRIKDFLDLYSVETESKIRSSDLNIPIDKITLMEYTASSQPLKEILDKIILEYGVGRERINDKLSFLGQLFDILHTFEVNTIEKLDNLLKENKDDIPKFFKKYKPELTTDSLLGYDVVFIYLFYLIIYREYSDDRLFDLLKTYEVDEPAMKKIILKFNELLDEGYKI